MSEQELTKLLFALENYEGKGVHLELKQPLMGAWNFSSFRAEVCGDYLMFIDDDYQEEPVSIEIDRLINYEEDLDVTIIGFNVTITLSKI